MPLMGGTASSSEESMIKACGVPGDTCLSREYFLFQLLRWIFSDKVLAGTSMGNAFLHGNYWIEQDLEVGTGFVTAV